MLNFSEACERNKIPILEQLSPFFAERRAVLEIGSGSGQHALYLASAMPWLRWQPTEVAVNLDTLGINLLDVALDNMAQPVCLDVNSAVWPTVQVDAVFSANTLHIIAWTEVEAFFTGAGQLLAAGGKLAVYGPFRYQDQYTSASNAQFDQWLKARDPRSGIRDFEQVAALAVAQGFQLVADHAMPANNQLLLFKKQ